MAINIASAMGCFMNNYVLSQYNSQVKWGQRITPQTAGATPTPTWDPLNYQARSFSDGSFGVGWQLGTALGYIPKGYVRIGIQDTKISEEQDEAGIINYESPIALVADKSILLTKGDILARDWGTPQEVRYVVKDSISPAQIYGQTVFYMYYLDRRELADIIYTVPL